MRLLPVNDAWKRHRDIVAALPSLCRNSSRPFVRRRFLDDPLPRYGLRHRMPQGYEHARTTIFPCGLPLSFFTASKTSLRAFNAVFFRQYDFTPSIRHTVLLSLSRQYASMQHDLSAMDWKRIALLFSHLLSWSRSVSWEFRYEVMISFLRLDATMSWRQRCLCI